MIVFAFVVIVLSAQPSRVWASGPQCEEYKNPNVRKVVQLVHEAVALVGKEGKSAFKEFSEKGSKWFKGDVYIYVHAMSGTLVANGAFPSLVGSNMVDFRDLTKKLVVRQSIDQVTKYGRDSGWIHYLWPVPGQVNPSWKSSFVHLAKGPDGEKYYVGAGLYNAPMEACFVVNMVNDASMLIEREGAKAFPYIRSRSGPFLWKDTYVFVLSHEGTTLVNPAQPKLEGQDSSKLRDSNGVMIVEAMKDVASKTGAGWVQYQWPKPGMVPASKKHTYVRRVRSGGKEYIVGCGLYLD